MKEVITIDGKVKSNDKPVEFTHDFDSRNGWVETETIPDIYEMIVYLGCCDIDGDMFACYLCGTIDIAKGHLNSGKY